jgi:hypothetical protein
MRYFYKVSKNMICQCLHQLLAKSAILRAASRYSHALNEALEVY